VRLLSRAEIAGDTLEERVGSLVDIIWAHYRRPAFLAGVQIVLNLSKDPRTGDDTVAALADSERSIADQWQRLVDDVLPGDDRRRALGTVIYEIVRGTAIGAGLMDAMPHLGPKARAGEDTRAALVRALTLLVTAG